MVSNVVGCSTGRSAGFAPLRILSTNVAERATHPGAQPLREAREPGHVASGRARFSAMIVLLPKAAMTSTLRLTSSAASSGSRSKPDSADRDSMTRFFPSTYAEIAEALPKRLQVPRCGGVRVAEMGDAPDLRRLLRIAGERQRGDAEGEGSGERGASGRHAATVCAD